MCNYITIIANRCRIVLTLMMFVTISTVFAQGYFNLQTENGHQNPFLLPANGWDTLWTKTFGGPDWDLGQSVQQTSDYGYIIVGYTGQLDMFHDVYLIKTDVNGDTLWTKTYGSEGMIYNDRGYSVQQTSDNGYILVGQTSSIDAGTNQDVYLVKTDVNGDTLWTRTYGGISDEAGYSVLQTMDGGFIVVGKTSSFGAGSSDIWLIKTDMNGDTLWTRTFGGDYYDLGSQVQQTTDNGYIIVGRTLSFGAGSDDMYLVKTDVNGNILWTRTYGGTGSDDGRSVQQTTDNGYIIVGYTNSYGAVYGDVWLIKTDMNGDTLWTRTFGGDSFDLGSQVQQTTDNGYIIVGYTDSYGAGNGDVWLIKTDVNGDILWTQTYGGVYNDAGSSIQLTSDGGYILAGQTQSFGSGGSDVWLIKTNIELEAGSVSGTVTLNGGSGNTDSVLISAEPGGNWTKPVNGSYILPLYQGDYNITASVYGYFPQTYENVLVNAGDTTLQNFSLDPVAVSITPDSLYFETAREDSTILTLENQTDRDIDYQISVELSDDVELHYDGPNVNSVDAGPDLGWAIRFTPEELSEYYNGVYKISKIQCFFAAVLGTVTFKVWEGGSLGNPGTEVYSAIDSNYVVGNWTTHALSTPVLLNSGTEYWVGAMVTGIPAVNFPFGIDAGPMVSGKGGWTYYMGAWYQLIDFGLNANWNIQASISQGWLTCNPISGLIPAYSSRDVNVAVDATGLSGVDYFGDIFLRILPDLFTQTIPVYLINEYSNEVEVEFGAPLKFELAQNYPNPFNPSTTIEFAIPQASYVTLKVYNVLGQEVKTLISGFKDAGAHTINFDASQLPSGLYIYCMQAGDFVSSKKMILIK